MGGALDLENSSQALVHRVEAAPWVLCQGNLPLFIYLFIYAARTEP